MGTTPLQASESRAPLTHLVHARTGDAHRHPRQQEYETRYDYAPDSQADLSNFHNPTDITETGAPGELTRTTHLVYEPPADWPYVLGLRTSETTTVGGLDTKVKSWTYDDCAPRPFRCSETLYGIKTIFTPDDFGNVVTVTKASGMATSFTYEWGQIATTSTPNVVTTRAINPDGTVASDTTNGRTTVYHYDDLMRLRRQDPPEGVNSISTADLGQ